MNHVKSGLGLMIFLALAPLANLHAEISDIEQLIVIEVDKNTPNAIATLEQLVNINSGTMNF